MDQLFWLTRPLQAAGGDAAAAAGAAAARRLLSEGGMSSGQTAIYVVVSVLLVIFAGMMAGLTLGLLSLGETRDECGLHGAPDTSAARAVRGCVAAAAGSDRPRQRYRHCPPLPPALPCRQCAHSSHLLPHLIADNVDLEVIRRSGTERERWLVGQVAPVRCRPAWHVHG